MMVWLMLALMTAAAMFVAVRPLLFRAGAAQGDGDLAVYRDQLAEIERDLARGVIAAPEAAAARVEISRRLLAAAERADGETATLPSPAQRRRFRVITVAVLAVLPLGAVALYLALGSPDLSGLPLAERLAAARAPVDAEAPATFAALVVRAEEHLQRNPEDGRGWEVLAPAYMRLERFDDAVKARGNALRLLGPTADRHAALGEALTAASGGIITPSAKAEFERALDLDRGHVTAALYLGLAAKQSGQREEARRIWEAMIARAPDGAEWVSFVRQAIAALGEPASGAVSPPAPVPGALASGGSNGGQREMARGMVERLAARLAENGSDVEGWLRLVRSYLVLGEPDKARAAAGDARRALDGDADKLRRLDHGMKALGVEG